MKSVNCVASQCGRCRFYTPTGRRGGECAQLGVPVKANWKACQLACHPFETDSFETESFNTSNFLSDLNPLASELLVAKALVELEVPEIYPLDQRFPDQHFVEKV